MPRPSLRSRAAARLVVLTIAFALIAPAAPAMARPDLVVTAVGPAPRMAREGVAFRIGDTVRNVGRFSAAPSVVRYYLTRNPRASLAERARSVEHPRAALGDILLGGSRAVPSLRRGAASVGALRRRALVVVPIGTPVGTYTLLACADDRGSVVEAREPGNCRAAGTKVRVLATGRALRLDAFSDTAPTTPTYLSKLQGVLETATSGCVKPVALRVPPLATSLRSTKAWLTNRVGARDMARFQRSLDYRSPRRLQNAAAAALIHGRPAAALAALIRLHELQPREASHLVAAASLASSVGRPLDALAMLQAAARLDDADMPAMGISRHATVLAARGTALVNLGQYAAARRPLQLALATEPLLTEAAASLATANLCDPKLAGRSRAGTLRGAGSALPTWQQAMRRQAVPPPGMDISRGTAATIRSLPFPASVEEAASQPAFWTSLYRSEGAIQMANLTRREELRRTLRDKPALPIERRRQTGLLFPFSFSFVDPELAAIAAREVAAKQEVSRIAAGFGSDEDVAFDIASAECRGVPDPCYDLAYQRECAPRLRARHGQWYAAMVRAYAIAGEHVAMSSARGAGVAANLGDPDAYAYAMAHVEMADSFYVRSYAQEAQSWTGTVARSRSTCLDDPPPTAAPDAVGEFGERATGPCPPELKAINAVAEFGDHVAVKVKCDEVTVEGTLTPDSWISGFGEVTYNRNGQLTIVAGAKAEVGKGLKGDFKSALYITVSSTEIVDVGWKVGPSTTVGDGPVQFNPEGTMDLTFLPSRPPAEFPTYVDGA